MRKVERQIGKEAKDYLNRRDGIIAAIFSDFVPKSHLLAW